MINNSIFNFSIINYSDYKEIDVISKLLRFVRVMYNDYNTIARMFSKFDDSKNRIQNCDNENSLTNIFYYGGNAHTINIKKCLDFIIDQNNQLEREKNLFEDNIKLLYKDINKINLQKKILDDLKFNN